MDFSTLASLRKYLSIKHHVPGRIRIKFASALASDPLAKELQKSDTTVPEGVQSVRLNTLARSVIIEYDAESVSPALLEELVTTGDDARAAEILRELDTILRNTSNKEVN